MLVRRTFMKLGVQAVGALSVVRYADAFQPIPESRMWIEDKGDFCIVRVPENKTFDNEVFEKPVIFIMGDGANVLRTTVNSFSNFAVGRNALVSDCVFDVGNSVMKDRKEVVIMDGHSATIQYCRIDARSQAERAWSIDFGRKG